jgi:hypothetical protein
LPNSRRFVDFPRRLGKLSVYKEEEEEVVVVVLVPSNVSPILLRQ